MDRKHYLDWLRGVGVIIMIQGHVIDSWTLFADHSRPAYKWINIVGGLGGAPIFLFLAGVALALAAGARMRNGRTAQDVAALARKRAWQVFGLALLFRLQSWAISGGGMQTILKVDILNVMGVSMLGAAILWGLGRGRPSRAALLMAAACAVALMTPLVRASNLVSLLPDPIEWYLRPRPSGATFTLLPWAGFLLAGAAVGLWLDTAHTPRQERRLNLGLAAAGVAIGLAGLGASWLPPVYAQSSFWTSSPTFFFFRLGIVMTLVPVAYAVNRAGSRSRLAEFGRSSLFVYWIHVEMAYGVVSFALHHRLPLELAYLGFILLTLLLYGIVKVKNHLQTAKGATITKKTADIRTPLST